MIGTYSRLSRGLFTLYGVLILSFLYMPLLGTALASFSKKRYVSFPISQYTTKWYSKAYDSLTIAQLVETSFFVALAVTAICIVVGFFGALAYARYEWKGRRVFQKFLLLPIFFPQAVLGLALLLWFNFLGIVPSWKTAIVAHLVWVAPIGTLIMAIQAYSFDPSLEEAARDMGATRWQVFREITFPLLLPGVLSGGLFCFLLSWGNFPLSLFTTGADSTLPEWLYAKMIMGYSPLVPTVGTLTVVGAGVFILAGFFVVLLFKRVRSW
ncbi:MAG: spermidine/putrescine ABC transporter permease [Rhodospirillaceae bacterium]|jgi:spermidine/putrescine transport system permease protein|nr:spermidine/putrescine ABC transporter permease [Rhodospirillaceae bacterium]|tara:strand:- start:3412 stop:4215 length:804 start_codon:yes stop_codon:yes gene_type:complete